jgi:hypothetical protein
MKSSKLLRHTTLSVLLALTLAACDGDEAAELTTTSSLVASPSSDESSATSVAPADSTTTTLVGQSVGNYEIVARESDSAGETLYVVIPPGAYTDVDIENFVLDLIEAGTVTFGAEIFDDTGAVDAYRKPAAERTEGETQLLDEHHFVSLLNGNTIRFQGPFASSGEYIIGS